jgi:hypothetical protein
MRSTSRVAAIATLCTLALAACEPPESDGWMGTVTDSAGVTVVTNPEAGLWTATNGWAVDEDLSIGEVEGNPDYLFGVVAGVCVGSSGEVVVVDQQMGSVRVFDADGNLQHIFGGLGEGPGEFGSTLAGCYVGPGDTIAIPDLQLYRVSRFLIDGTELGAVPFDLGDGVPIRWAMRHDGRLAVHMRLGLLDPSAAGTSDALVLEEPDGRIRRRFVRLPSSEVIRRADGRARFTLLAPQPVWTLAPDGGAWVFGADEYRLMRYDANGVHTMTVARPAAAQPVTDGDRTVIADAIAETFPPGLVTNVLGGVNVAETFPFVYDLAIGPDETLWARRYRAPSTPSADPNAWVDAGPVDAEVFLADPTLRLGSPDWDVFDATGRYLGVVTLPEGFEPHTFAGDAIYGIWRDAMGVEYVKRLAISRVR